MQKRLSTISIILAFLAILAITCYFVWQPNYIGENPAMYLDCAKLLLAGKQQYIDFIDLNPPLATYLACLPVLAAGALKLPITATFEAMIISVMALSVVLTGRTCLRLFQANPDEAYAIMPFALAICNLPLLFCFGERDHLITLALVPFFFFRMYLYKIEPGKIDKKLRWEQAIIGLMAGIALPLKPQCGLIVLLPELYFVLSSSKKRPLLSLDILLALLFIVLYGLHFLLLPPAIRVAYFDRLLPLITAHYNAFNVPLAWAATLYTYWGPLLRSFAVFPIILALALLGRKRSELLSPLICFALGAYLVYVMQAKGWGYQTIHVLAACFLISGALMPILFKMIAEQTKKSPAQDKLVLAEMILLLAISPVFAQDSSSTGKELADCDQWIAANTAPGDAVLIISSAVSPAYPSLFLHDRKNGSRYLWSAPLVMLDQAARGCRDPLEAENIASQERIFFEHLEQDIHERKPKLVMIEYFQPVGARSMFEIVSARGILQNDLGAYKRLGRCNRFIGFLYQAPAQAPFAGSYADQISTDKVSGAEAEGEEKKRQEALRFKLFARAMETIAQCDRKILFSPSAQDYTDRGDAYQSICMYQMAVADFERVLKIKKTAETFIKLGQCRLRLEQFPEATEAFNDALAIEPSTAAHSGLAQALAALGKRREAIGEARLASGAGLSANRFQSKTAPIEDSKPICLAYAASAAAHRAMGMFKEAEIDADTALMYDDKSQAASLEKAWILDGQGKHKEMLPLVDRLLSQDFNNTAAHRCRAAALEALGRAPEAASEQTIADCLSGKE